MSDHFDEVADILRQSMPNKIITNFVLVCEVVTEDGAELIVNHSESMTPWLGAGMLLSAQDILQSTNPYVGDDED